jgi:hypothetical protein
MKPAELIAEQPDTIPNDRLRSEVAGEVQAGPLSDAEDVLRRNGFVRCDLMACNCGSWHARYGLPERMAEIKEALSDAGHPLRNGNSNLVSKALAALIAERDELLATLIEATSILDARSPGVAPTLNSPAYRAHAVIARATGGQS